MFDYLHDEWDYSADLLQLRGELSWLWAGASSCGTNEIGFWFTAGVNDASNLNIRQPVFVGDGNIKRMANVLKTEKKIMVVSMLAEGTSIRSIERITGINRNTVMSLGLRVGAACEKIAHAVIRGDRCKFESTAQELGYRIGAQIYEAYLAGKVAPSGLRRLFLAHLDEPGLARKVCAAIIAKLRAGSRNQKQ